MAAAQIAQLDSVRMRGVVAFVTAGVILLMYGWPLARLIELAHASLLPELGFLRIAAPSTEVPPTINLLAVVLHPLSRSGPRKSDARGRGALVQAGEHPPNLMALRAPFVAERSLGSGSQPTRSSLAHPHTRIGPCPLGTERNLRRVRSDLDDVSGRQAILTRKRELTRARETVLLVHQERIR